jgi:prepilin-type processing-associated H-X9-DG protein
MAGSKTALRYAELIAGIAILTVVALVLLPAFSRGQGADALPSCQGNLKQWGTVFAMYQQENFWCFPRVHGFEAFGKAENAYHCANVHDEFAFCPDLRAIIPDYATDLKILACPSSRAIKHPPSLGPFSIGGWTLDEAALGVLRSQFAGHCEYEGAITNGGVAYTYFGWRIDAAEDTDPQIDEATALRLGLPAAGPAQVVAMLTHVEPGRANTRFMAMRDQNFDMRRTFPTLSGQTATWGNDHRRPSVERLFTGTYLSDTLARGGMGLAHEREFVARPWYPNTPVMWDTIYLDSTGAPVFAHQNPDGVNVLFMDGHVEFREFPGKFPVSRTFVTMKAIPVNDAS